MIGRAIGILFLSLAAVSLLRDVLVLIDAGVVAPLATDQLWSTLFPVGFAHAGQWGTAHLSWLWDPILSTILALPACLLAAAIGVLFLWGARKPRRRRTRLTRGALRT